VETAYKAVMKPKEGTILTVARGVSEKASEIASSKGDDLKGFFEEMVRAASDTLEKTPDMLPVLKQAGVVDSGGCGLLRFLEGALDGYNGAEVDLDFSDKPADEQENDGDSREQKVETKSTRTFLYCTEFIIHQKEKFTINAEKDLMKYLSSMGDGIALVSDDDVVKVHLYTNDPGIILQRGLKIGPLTNVSISNVDLEEEKNTLDMKSAGPSSEGAVSFEEQNFGEHKDAAFVSVSIGDGLKEIFQGLGCDAIIDGGQTMNPSTDDILSAVEKINADTVYIFPNNKNIVLAANQAASMTHDKKAVVIPTRTVAQGITAILNYMPDSSVEDNTQAMIEEIASVRTGQVTYAVRDTVIDDREIKQGDFMGIGDHGLLSVGSSLEDTAFDMTTRMMDKGIELISVYYGLDVDESDAKKLVERIEKKYPACDVELQYGGQPVYYYVISAE
ncbi:MAG: DAK2 domain-containing protein, partial [Lachnospiraceae bacterium]|nr:DAK2 domain-containing protein [Lachnospiraceae bacterium]